LLKAGALPKPEVIKSKTINFLDVLLGADGDYVGAVGFFDPILPDPSEVPADVWDGLVQRHEQREREFAMWHSAMAALAERPVGPGRYVLGGRGNTVVFGYDAAGRLQPVTGDHDLFDIRHSDGRRLRPRELLELITAMVRRKMGVQHPAVKYWQPADDVGRWMKEGLIAPHQPGGEPLVRFAPAQPPRLVDAATPVGARPRERLVGTRVSWRRRWGFLRG
jgi:hypothetical protein